MASEGSGGGKRAIIAAFAANLAIAIAKIVAFALTGAASLAAEAIHSVADSGNQGLLLFGDRRSRRPADERHPFGFGRERYFWAFVVALVLFSVGGLFAIAEGIDKLRHPHHLSDPLIAFVVLGVAVVAESFSLRTAVIETGHVKLAGMSYPAFIRRTTIPELPVVLLEDVAALIGLVFALAGLTASELTGNARFDAVGSISIGVLLVVVAGILAREMKSLLIGEAAEPQLVRRLTATLEQAPAVRSVIHLRTLQLGPGDLLVAAKVELPAELPYAEMVVAIDQTEALLREAVPSARLIFVEPDVRRPG